MAVTLAALSLVPAAGATPVATNDAEYAGLGRVFPEPLAGCAGGPVCSPSAQGNVPATQFVQLEEFYEALRFMNTNEEWQRYMEVWPLDGKDDAHENIDQAWPGNNLGRLEFDPAAEFKSAGLPQTDRSRKKSDLIVVRVTDETVPDENKKRYALSLSIHGIERAGAEGGIRTMEDFVTAASTEIDGQPRTSQPILPENVEAGAPTFGEVLRNTIVYYTFPNPDGWRRGSVTTGGVFFQRYNGNGVDLNRDWPDIGFTFRPYSGLSEPESRAFNAFYQDVMAKTNSTFAAGDDLHGMPAADALSYTLMPHGLHEFDKDIRIRESSKAINRATYESVKWSPIVRENDEIATPDSAPCTPDTPVGPGCSQIYGQTWGTVYDTINYTVTGALGDWFDSRIGLNSDGIDNEMAFSHVDKNINFDPHTEQMHVDGNRALIMARLAEILNPPTGAFDAPGRKGYVENERLAEGQKDYQPGAPPGTRPQDDIPPQNPDPGDSAAAGGWVFPIDVQRSNEIYNGGMRVEITTSNVGGVGPGGGPEGISGGALKVQCKGCDDHPHDEDAAPADPEEWITVAEDFNQSPLYLQSGLTAAVNNPDVAGPAGRVEWRALVNADVGVPSMTVDFSSGPASFDGNTEGGLPPFQRAYDVANTDFFRDLDGHVANRREDFDAIDPRRVIAGSQSLDNFDSIALADNPLPGYTGLFRGERQLGPPTANFDFASAQDTQPGFRQVDVGPRAPNSYETKEFTIGENDGNAEMTIRVEWPDSANDFDMYLYRKVDGSEESAGSSTTVGGTSNFEEITLERPPAGEYILYVDNFDSGDPQWTGTARFRGLAAADDSRYSAAEKEAWFRELGEWVEGGGNLILTDGALRALPEFTNIPASAVSKQDVYVGQVAFSTDDDTHTLGDPLAAHVNQPGSRFNSGMRRQIFEPTPLGFAIQDSGGGDDSNARQWQVKRDEFEKAGGRITATGVSSDPDAAAPLHDQVTVGEIKRGAGQLRIAGSLLPQPSDEFDHQFGVEPYAVTYTGYILVRNLFGGRGALPGSVDTGRNFVISRRAVKLRKRRARVRVSCRIPRGGCQGRLRLRVRRRVLRRAAATAQKRKKLRVIGSKRFDIPSGRKRNFIVKVKLKKRPRAAIARVKRRARVRARANVSFADGAQGIYKRRFWLYRPSNRRR